MKKGNLRIQTPADDRVSLIFMAKSRDIINSEISETNPDSKFLKSFNEMFDLFEESYNKNVLLMKKVKEMNEEIHNKATDTRSYLKASDEANNELKKLKEEFSNAIKEFEKARGNLANQEYRAFELRSEIDELKSLIQNAIDEETPDDDFNELKQEVEKNKEMIQDLQNQILIENEAITDAVYHKEVIGKEIENSEKELQVIKELPKIEEMKSDVISYNDMIKSNIIKQKELDKEIEERKIKVESLKNDLNNLKVSLLSEKGVSNHDMRKAYKKQLGDVEERNSNLELLRKNKKEKIQELEKEIEDKESILREESSKVEEKEVVFKSLSEKHVELRRMKKEYARLTREKIIMVTQRNASNNALLEQKKTTEIDINASEMNCLRVQKNIDQEGQKFNDQVKEVKNKENAANQYKLEMRNFNEKALAIIDEIEEKTEEVGNLRSLVSSIVADNIIKEEENKRLEEKVAKLKNSIELQKSEIIKISKERETIKRAYEDEVGQFDNLKGKNVHMKGIIKSYTETLENTENNRRMTKEKTKSTKEINENLQVMINYVIEGNEYTKNMNIQLINEQQTLRRIIEQDKTTIEQQKKDCSIMVQNLELISNRIKEKEGKIEDLKSIIKTNEHVVSKRTSDYQEKAEEIQECLNQLEALYAREADSVEKIKYVQKLKKDMKELETQVLFEKSKVTAFSQIIEVPVNLHPLARLDSLDHQSFIKHRVKGLITSELVDAEKQLKKLKEERDGIQRDVDQLKAKCENTVSKAQVELEIAKYQKHISSQEDLMNQMRKEIEHQKLNCISSEKENESIQEKYRQKINLYAQLRCENLNAVASEKEKEMQQLFPQLEIKEPDDDPLSFITEPKLSRSPRPIRKMPTCACGFNQNPPKMEPIKIHIKDNYGFSPVLLSARRLPKKPYLLSQRVRK